MTQINNFDKRSGSWFERLIFNYRIVFVLFCTLISAYLGFAASHLEINASYQKMQPSSQQYVLNYRQYQDDLGGLGNVVRIVVENKNGTIYTKHYLQVLQEINDEVYLLPGVDRPYMKSLWRPAVRWQAVTPEGFVGGPVIAADYDGSPSSLGVVKHRVQQAGLVGSLVSTDRRSSMLVVPLLELDPDTGRPINYRVLHKKLEAIEAKYDNKGVAFHVIGFAQLAGDLIQGLQEFLGFFLIAAVVVSLITYWYTRCIISTVVVLLSSIVGVVWQLGLMQLMGFVLNPFSAIVPFLVFAIGVSHGSQMMSGVMQDTGHSLDRYAAARSAFRRLYLAGLAALLADAAGFAVLYVIDIPIVQNLALGASFGIVALIFTNLLLIPVVLSYTGMSKSAVDRAARTAASKGRHPLSRGLAHFAERRKAGWVLGISAVIGAVALFFGLQLEVGTVGQGAPELRADSKYNQDAKYIGDHYTLSGDVFAVIVTSPKRQGIGTYESLKDMDALERQLKRVPGVQATESVASVVRTFTPASFEGSLKWYTISRYGPVTNSAVNNVSLHKGRLINSSNTVAPLLVYLSNHNGRTLDGVENVVQKFAAEHNTKHVKFRLAAGNAGIQAAINKTVASANLQMILLVYLTVAVLCGIAFRSWRAVVVAIIPLGIVTLLTQALMVAFGIGLNIATLPVTALGIGIGVDYALYLLTIYLVHLREGASPEKAYLETLLSTGKVVALVGITLTAAVVTWIWSPIKFQAEMGLLLGFMFLGNMIGALVILPSLATFLLPQRKKSKFSGVDSVNR